MSDIVDKAKRSAMMSGIRNKNTRPELLIRTALFARGYRYRLHVSHLAGKPDIVFPKYKALVFVQGCFWHAHQCHLFKWPSTREDFWRAKILSNKIRDEKNQALLQAQGWRIAVVWECSLKGKYKLDQIDLIDTLDNWLQSTLERLEINAQDSLC